MQLSIWLCWLGDHVRVMAPRWTDARCGAAWAQAVSSVKSTTSQVDAKVKDSVAANLRTDSSYS